ncbi:hypothetical protein FHS25_006389, partial [Rhizobium laguerreae]|nr:hypothetical protein [Rhizobium laguerreae]
MIPWGRNNDELLNESLFFGLDHARSAPLLNGRTITILFHNAHLSMLLKGISFPDLDAILWGVEGS